MRRLHTCIVRHNNYRMNNGLAYYQYSPYAENAEFQWEEKPQPPGECTDPYYSMISPRQLFIGEAGYGYSHEEDKKGSRRRIQEFEEDKARYVINLDDIMARKDMRTTLMIKNIPNKYTQKMLLRKIDVNSKRHYDFLYLPIDFKVIFCAMFHRINAMSDMLSLTSFAPFTLSSSMRYLTQRNGRNSIQEK